MIEGSYEPAPDQVSLKRLEVFGKDYVGKRVRFSNVVFLGITAAVKDFIGFRYKDGSGTGVALADKNQWAEFLLGLEDYDRINIEGVVVDLLRKPGIIVTDIEKAN